MHSRIYHFFGINLSYRKIIFLSVSLGILIILSSFLGTIFLQNNENTPDWQFADEIVPTTIINKAITENSISSIDTKKIKATKFSHQEDELFIFYFQSKDLRGVAGSLYAVYDNSGEKLLTVIANPNLPAGEKLFQAENTLNNKLFCLNITQSTKNINVVSRSKYCYQNNSLIHVDETLAQVN